MAYSRTLGFEISRHSSIQLMTALALVAALLTLSGCHFIGPTKIPETTAGENYKVSFFEPNSYPMDYGSIISTQSLDRPVAIGSRIGLSVLVNQQVLGKIQYCSVVSVTSENPDVLKLAGEGDWHPSYGRMHYLQAVSEGTSRIEYTIQCPEPKEPFTDAIVLSTTTANEATVGVLYNSLTPTPFQPFGAKGLALRPGAELPLGAVAKKNGKPLLGFDFLEWETDETLLDLTKAGGDKSKTAGSTVNSCYVKGLGVVGLATVSTQFGGNLELATLSNEAVPTVKIIGLLDMADTQEETTLITGDQHVYFMVGFDEEERYVIPSTADDENAAYEVIEGEVDNLVIEFGAGVFAVKSGIGNGIISLSYMGQTITLPFDLNIEAQPEAGDDLGDN